jgi:hypothetical protein
MVAAPSTARSVARDAAGAVTQQAQQAKQGRQHIFRKKKKVCLDKCEEPFATTPATMLSIHDPPSLFNLLARRT